LLAKTTVLLQSGPAVLFTQLLGWAETEKLVASVTVALIAKIQVPGAGVVRVMLFTPEASFYEGVGIPWNVAQIWVTAVVVLVFKSKKIFFKTLSGVSGFTG